MVTNQRPGSYFFLYFAFLYIVHWIGLNHAILTNFVNANSTKLTSCSYFVSFFFGRNCLKVKLEYGVIKIQKDQDGFDFDRNVKMQKWINRNSINNQATKLVKIISASSLNQVSSVIASQILLYVNSFIALVVTSS